MSNDVVEIEIRGKDGASRVLKVINGELEEMGETAARSSSRTSKGMAETEGAAGKLSGQIKDLAAGFIGLEVVSTGIDWARQAAAAEGVAESFENIARTAKTTGDALRNELRAASQGMISDSQLMATANKAILQGGSEMATALPQFLRIAGAAARATGQDMGFLFDSLVEGTTKAEPEILDNLGLTINLTQVYDAYAKSIGTTANNLTQAQKSQALMNEVLRQGEGYIQKIGAGTESQAATIAQATVAWDKFWMAAKGGVADFVVAEIEGIKLAAQGIAGFGDRMGEINAIAVNGLNSYEQYVAALRAVGEEGQAMSEAQFNAAVALVKSGADAQVAATNVQALAKTEQQLAWAFSGSGEAGLLSADAKAQLMQRTLELAGAYPDAVAGVEGMTYALQFGWITIDEYNVGLDELLSKQYDNQEASYANAEANAVGAAAVQGLTGSVWDMSDATWASIEAKANAQIEAQRLAQFEDDLAAAIAATNSSQLAGAMASAQLSAQYGIELTKINALIAGRNEYNKTMAGKVGVQVGAAAARGIGNMVGLAEAGYADHMRPAPKKGRAKTGKSDAVKAAEKEQKELERLGKQEAREREQVEKKLADLDKKIAKEREKTAEKLEQIDRAHTEKIGAIWEDFYADQAATIAKFNSDKFDAQLAFDASLIEADAATRAAMLAVEADAWEKAQQLAQTGGEEIAQEYYDMRLAQAEADRQRAAQIADLRRQAAEEADAEKKAELEAQAAYAEQVDARQDQRDADKLAQLQARGQELEQERDQQLADENESYAEARAKLVEQYGEQVADIIAGQDEMLEAHEKFAAQIVASYAAIAAAAGVPIGANGDQAAGVDGSHAGGLARVPRDGYVARLHEDEEVLAADNPRNQNNPHYGEDVAPGRSALPAAAPTSAPTGGQAALRERAQINNFYGYDERRVARTVRQVTGGELRKGLNKGKTGG